MEENYNKLVGNRIKNLREQNGEYQKETAEAITKMGEKLSEGQLGLYEIGARKLPPNITKALAIHFNTTTDYILGRTDDLKSIDDRLKKHNISTAASADIDLNKYAELDDDKKDFVKKQMNAMIDMFLQEKKKKNK